jgi:hypothetical protein
LCGALMRTHEQTEWMSDVLASEAQALLGFMPM